MLANKLLIGCTSSWTADAGEYFDGRNFLEVNHKIKAIPLFLHINKYRTAH